MTPDLIHKAITNKLLDFLFRRVSANWSNERINRDLKKRKMPRMSEEQLENARTFFRKAEISKPDVVDRFRARVLSGAIRN